MVRIQKPDLRSRVAGDVEEEIPPASSTVDVEEERLVGLEIYEGVR
jgi:hypothetical protein